MENFYAFYDPETGRIVQRTTVYREVDDRKLLPEEEQFRRKPKLYEEAADEQAAAMGLLAVKSYDTLPLQTTYIDVETKEHKSMGEKPSPHHEWSWSSHQWVLKAEATDGIWQGIASERDRRSLESGVKVNGVWFHTDVLSRSKYTNVLLTGAAIDGWKAMGGVFVRLDTPLARLVAQAIATNDTAIFEAAQAHRAALEASPHPEQYDWHGGWPITYQEATA